jgi:hypothetical protein
MNPFTSMIDLVEDYPELGIAGAMLAVVCCTIAGILWG